MSNERELGALGGAAGRAWQQVEEDAPGAGRR